MLQAYLARFLSASNPFSSGARHRPCFSPHNGRLIRALTRPLTTTRANGVAHLTSHNTSRSLTADNRASRGTFAAQLGQALGACAWQNPPASTSRPNLSSPACPSPLSPACAGHPKGWTHSTCQSQRTAQGEGEVWRAHAALGCGCRQRRPSTQLQYSRAERDRHAKLGSRA